MKKLISIVIVGGLYTSILAQSGKVFDNLSMESKILGGERKYALYLPPGYETSERSYPVLYLLHGGGDDQTGWIQFGEAPFIADQEIRSGKATSMLIVMPDANTGRRGYFNAPDGQWAYEDFFFKEFIPFIEKTYRVKTKKRYRAIAGQSMGGGGTLIYALHHPDMFSTACPLSFSTPIRPADVKRRFERREYNYTDDQIQAYYRQHSALALVDSLPADLIKSVRWYMDCGDDDFLYEGNALIHIAMRKKDIPHEFRIRDGVHEWPYWRESLPSVLEFITIAFRQDED
jgi:enterochelin esterase-like enzyme